MGRGPSKQQFNIRVDSDLLTRYREYCERNGLDPSAQVVLFLRRVVDAEMDFMSRLWDALRAETD